MFDNRQSGRKIQEACEVAKAEAIPFSSDNILNGLPVELTEYPHMVSAWLLIISNGHRNTRQTKLILQLKIVGQKNCRIFCSWVIVPNSVEKYPFSMFPLLALFVCFRNRMYKWYLAIDL